MFFNRWLGAEKLAEYHAQLQDESYAAFLDMLILDLPRPRLVTQPVLVIGAEQDRIFSPAQIHATAKAYRTEAVMFADMAHDMMLDPHWPKVAERIFRWCSSLALPQANSAMENE